MFSKSFVFSLLIIGIVYCNATSIPDPVAALLKSIKNIPVLENVVSIQGITNNNCLELHNQLRAKHGVPALEFDEEIEKYAQGRANELAEIDEINHDDLNSAFGENLFGLSSSQNETEIDFCQLAIDSFYNQEKYYSFDNPIYNKKTNYFTQLIWKSTTKLGCAKSKSKSSGNYHVVCNYDERGNVKDQFEENVLQAK